MESKSLKIILDEIDKRIDGYNEQLKIIQADSLDRIQAEFHTKLDSLTIDDLINSTTTTKNKLIEIINFEKRDFDLSTDQGLNSLFDKIKDYIDLNNKRIEENKSNITKCLTYKNFFTGIDKEHDLFDKKDKESLDRFVGSLGLGISEQIELEIEKYIANYNLKARVIKDKDPEINNSVTSIYRDIYNYENVKEYIKEYIKKELNNKVDLNLIDNHFAIMADSLGKTKETVEYVFYMMILGQGFYRYLRGLKEEAADNLLFVHKVLQQYTFDDMKSIEAEANRIVSMEMSNIRGRYIDFEEIVVTDATTAEEFEDLKDKKKAMVAYLLKNKVKDYETNANFELKDKYKELISGLINEYHNIDLLNYKETEVKSR
jgi:hypothetical protein